MLKKQKNRCRPLVALTIVLFLSACGNAHDSPQKEAQISVETITVQPQVFTLSAELPGRIEPIRVAEVRARVAGIVLHRGFEEGSNVKAGQVLFQIDAAPFKAALSRAQGELAKTKAALAEARSIVQRYTPLVAVEAVSQQDFETAQTAVRSAQASEQSAAAEVEIAQMNLNYATVRAPISGHIGRALVTEGALVGQNEATPLAVIQQLDPIYADFKQPLDQMMRLRKSLADGKLKQTHPHTAPISVKVDGSSDKRDGQLLFSDVTVDRETGQVSLRGKFANPDALLLPGMYVRVQIDQGIDAQAILIPQRAVKRDHEGKAQVLVVDAKDIVQARVVETGVMRGAEWQILHGLQAGERVIIGAPTAIQVGSKVSVKAQTTLSPEAPIANTDEAGRTHSSL